MSEFVGQRCNIGKSIANDNSKVVGETCRTRISERYAGETDAM